MSAGQRNGQAAPRTGAASPLSASALLEAAGVTSAMSCPECGCVHTCHVGGLADGCSILAEQLAYGAARIRYQQAREAVDVARHMLELALEERDGAEDDLADHEAAPGLSRWARMAAEQRQAKAAR